MSRAGDEKRRGNAVVDHGDANPRAVAITKCDVDGKITDVRYNYAYSILGGIGDNATGVSVGGFALSK